MKLEEAREFQVKGNYSELMRAAIVEQIRAREEGRDHEELEWTIWVVKACRYVGRIKEGYAHSVHAIEKAGTMDNPVLEAAAIYSQALMLKVLDRPADAIDRLEEATKKCPAGKAETARAIYALEKTEILIDMGRREEATKELARASALVNWLGNPMLLAWVLYLRAIHEDPMVGTMDLMAALQIARSSGCPELEWQILWRLAGHARTEQKDDMARDFTWKALSILCKLAETLRREDVPSFWSMGARRQFVKDGENRFGPSFREKMVLGYMIPKEGTAWEASIEVDTKLLPSFVRKKLES